MNRSINRIWMFSLIVGLLMIAQTALSGPSQMRHGYFAEKINGNVQLIRKNKSQKLMQVSTLRVGDVIRTDRHSRVAVLFQDEEIHLAPHSSVKITGNGQVQLLFGSFYIKTGLSRKNPFVIKLPHKQLYLQPQSEAFVHVQVELEELQKRRVGQEFDQPENKILLQNKYWNNLFFQILIAQGDGKVLALSQKNSKSIPMHAGDKLEFKGESGDFTPQSIGEIEVRADLKRFGF